MRGRKKKARKKMRTRLEYERGHSFFMCKGCLTVRVTFEEAMESALRCGSCNGQLISEDNSRTVQALEDLPKKIEPELQERPAAFAPSDNGESFEAVARSQRRGGWPPSPSK